MNGTLTKQPKKMDSYSMMITSKYFRSRNDYINMICVNSKYKKILKQFRYNPIPIRTIKLFPKIQTQHIYTIYDVILDDVNRYVIWYPVQSYNDVIEEQNGKIKILKNISCVVGTNNYHLRTIPSCCTVLNRYLCDTLKTESLVLPTSITSLGSFCFFNLQMLKHIKLPNSLRNLPSRCFMQSVNLLSIDLSFVTSLGSYCFQNCTSLSSITITKHLENIGVCCFKKCSSLYSIAVHEKTSHIQHKIPYFLSMMLSQQNIECLRIQYTNSDVRRYGNNIPSICEEIGGKCFTNSHIQTINIPSTITSLQKKSFFMCLLSTVILPSTIKSIPNKCFQFCYGLKNIDCSHVTHLGDFCFYLCQNLTSLTLSSKLLTTGRACLDFCHTSLSILKGINTYPSTLFFNCYSTSLSIPSTISSIKSNSFCKSLHLREIFISDSVKYLGTNCFSSCYCLTTIHLPSNIVKVPNGCFQQCHSLQTIQLPNTITRLGKASFQTCYSLKNINVPSSVHDIANYCFYNCSSLSSITIPTTLKTLGFNCFKGCKSLNSIIIPSIIPTQTEFGSSSLKVFYY